MLAAIRRFTDEIADGFALGPVRAVIGALLGYHALVSAEELARVGYWGDLYHASMMPDVLVPSHRLYALLLTLRMCLSLMIIVGIWARPALVSSALFGMWMLLCDRNQFHHNR